MYSHGAGWAGQCHGIVRIDLFKVCAGNMTEPLIRVIVVIKDPAFMTARNDLCRTLLEFDIIQEHDELSG